MLRLFFMLSSALVSSGNQVPFDEFRSDLPCANAACIAKVQNGDLRWRVRYVADTHTYTDAGGTITITCRFEIRDRTGRLPLSAAALICPE
jgi:hypothetical protein